MAQINLLKQTTTSHSVLEFGPKILIRIFIVVLIVLVGYYFWLRISSANITNQIVQAQAQINLNKQTALSMPGRDELLTRQQQVKSLQGLIAGHVYWSQFFKPLADTTLSTASYSNLSVRQGGDLSLNVTVPTLADLDKYMQVFDQPEFNKNFSDVHISGFNKVQNANGTAIQFSVKMKYNPSLIQYQDPSLSGN